MIGRLFIFIYLFLVNKSRFFTDKVENKMLPKEIKIEKIYYALKNYKQDHNWGLAARQTHCLSFLVDILQEHAYNMACVVNKQIMQW